MKEKLLDNSPNSLIFINDQNNIGGGRPWKSTLTLHFFRHHTNVSPHTENKHLKYGISSWHRMTFLKLGTFHCSESQQLNDAWFLEGCPRGSLYEVALKCSWRHHLTSLATLSLSIYYFFNFIFYLLYYIIYY